MTDISHKGRNVEDHDATFQPIDPDLCAAGRELLAKLQRAAGHYAMFGHQEDERIRRDRAAASDVVAATGTFPAVFGFDLGGMERHGQPDFDGRHFDDIRDWIREDHRRGGIVTLTWHSVNPLTLGGYGHNLAAGSVAAVLPGGSRNERYRGWLDALADFAGSLRDDSGRAIPVVYRPFHEHNGDWFWWCIGGRNHLEHAEVEEHDGHDGQFGPEADATAEQFVELWRYTVTYLRDERQVHNFLYAISPDRSCIRLDPRTFADDWLQGYPGDDYVDVFGLDDYVDIGRRDNQGACETILAGLTMSLEQLSLLADRHGKPAAMTEIGTPNAMAGVRENPWTGFLDRAADANAATRRVLWYLTWTNSWDGDTNVYGTPLPGDVSGPDFARFSRSGYIRFLDRVTER
ncbi:MAG: glycoside hydrolase family 26 protein [Bifidobacterium sp.]|jgi:mannan endo-1,4-beta-mannosidase|nr:glycoside hydrolase family 26 protein [Bifidobacterium sp.]MCI1864905.1 glycoside hydrolase family 26 protein [Bifidobacterium sp.]